MADFINYCVSCALRAECEHTFGAYYSDKSRGGIGCNNRIHPFDLEQVRKRAKSVRHSDVLTANMSASNKTGIWHKYIVFTDDGREFTTSAKSEAHAINIVRFKHFENSPVASRPGLSAILVQSDGSACKPKPTKMDILKRLNRMRR